ncbi:uncharacterized protein DS421_1g32120 [Arachis hypogaea]|nr:uncharacterized protein DS421_1g32120 [Arachis hypogaea]
MGWPRLRNRTRPGHIQKHRPIHLVSLSCCRRSSWWERELFVLPPFTTAKETVGAVDTSFTTADASDATNGGTHLGRTQISSYPPLRNCCGMTSGILSHRRITDRARNVFPNSMAVA